MVFLIKGQFILLSHGKLIMPLTEPEYDHFKANEVKGFQDIGYYFMASLLQYCFRFANQTSTLVSRRSACLQKP